MSGTMKEVIVLKGTKTVIKDVPIPKPGPHQVLIKVVVSGSNPKDWKVPDLYNYEKNTGDDIAGIVEDVGEGVWEFSKGDRVMAFHQTMTDHGSFANYAIAWDWTTAKISPKIGFEGNTPTLPKLSRKL